MCESKKNARNNKIVAINMRTEEYVNKKIVDIRCERMGGNELN